MRNLLAIIFAFLLSAVDTWAQDITVKSFILVADDLSAKVAPKYDSNGVGGALVKVAVASSEVDFEGNIISVEDYKTGVWPLYVPSGTRHLRISVKGFAPVTVDFPMSVESFRTYELRIELPKTDKAKAIVLPTFSIGSSINSPHTSYGIMVGVAKKFGGYVRAKTDFVMDLVTEGECGEDGMVDSQRLWFTGNSRKCRWAVTAGGIARLAKPLYIYLGTGYGKRIFAWEDDTGTYYSIKNHSFSGIEAETGLVLRFGPVAISAGVQTNQFKYMETNFSIGFML